MPALPARRVLRGVGLLGALALAAGCGGADSTASALGAGLALVVGAHANAPAPQVPEAVAREMLAAAQGGARAAVVLNDGTPSVLVQGSLVGDAANPYAAEREAQAAALRLATTAREARADSAEADLLSALDQAARSIADVAGSRTVVVVDNGLPTAGALRFQEPGMLGADPAETAAYLRDTGALPALTGARVVFAGLGDTAPPQEALSPAQRANLVSLWTEIASAAGAASVDVLDAPLTGGPAPGLPEVTPVPVPPPPDLAPAAARPVTLTEETVAFRPDSAEYRDPGAAEESLRPLARSIAAQRTAVHLTGTTSSAGTPEGRRRLSLLRADTVKRTLVELGVPAESITTAGVGSDWPGYVVDRDAAGALLPGPAARNRTVVVQTPG